MIYISLLCFIASIYSLRKWAKGSWGEGDGVYLPLCVLFFIAFVVLLSVSLMEGM